MPQITTVSTYYHGLAQVPTDYHALLQVTTDYHSLPQVRVSLYTLSRRHYHGNSPIIPAECLIFPVIIAGQGTEGKTQAQIVDKDP